MEKQLFQDHKHDVRISELRSGSDKVAMHTYFKKFSNEEMQAVKDNLADKLLEIQSLEEKLKEIKEQYKKSIDPLKDESKGALQSIKQKGEFVTEECYILYDYDNNQAGIYNQYGELVEQRPLNQDERQKVIQINTLANGTND